MVELARHRGDPRYSDNVYHMAVVLMFPSRSSDEFLRQFLPLPAPSSIYDHFRNAWKDGRHWLKSLDQVGPYLDSRVAEHPAIATRAVLGVDAVSCANTFVGTKQGDESDITYLFVVHFQPLIPGPKCSPLFIVESKSGRADDAIQAKIDQIIAIARTRILRVLIASDGDPYYINRHIGVPKSLYPPLQLSLLNTTRSKYPT
jgi:hypothetical protein